MTELVLPNKEQVSAAVEKMRKAHLEYGYKNQLRDYYLETLFWSGFFAVYLNQQLGERHE